MGDLMVNTLGEIYRGNKCLLSHVNVTTVADNTLTPAERERWERGGLATHKGGGPLGAKMERAIAAEFARREVGVLTPAEKVIVDEIGQLAKLNNGRFRVYGGIWRGRVSVKLVTEFISFTDDAGQPAWKALKQKAKETGAKTWVVCKDTHIDHYGITTRGDHATSIASVLRQFKAAGRRLQNKGKPDAQGIIWSFGPNHGRPETQVELSWEVHGLTPVQLRTRIKVLSEALDELWQSSGVNVI